MKWVQASAEVAGAVLGGVFILSAGSELLSAPDTVSNAIGLAVTLVGSVALIQVVRSRVKAYTK